MSRCLTKRLQPTGLVGPHARRSARRVRPAAEAHVVRQRAWVIGLVLCVPLACGRPPEPSGPSEAQRTAAVYEALVRSDWFQQWFVGMARLLGHESLALEHQAVGGEAFAAMELPYGWASTPAWAALLDIMRQPGPPVSIAGFADFDAQAEAEIFGTSVFTPERYTKWSNWPEFYARYPQAAGVLGVSDVGLSPDGSEAI